MRAKASAYVVDLREIPAVGGGLERTIDLSGDLAKAALAETEAFAAADQARLSAPVTFIKSGDEVLVRGRIEGSVTMVCSRCVGPAPVTIAVPFDVLFLPKDADVPGVEEDLAAEEPDVVGYEDEQIDLEETLREEIFLALPYAPLCSEACKGLCANCGKDLNEGPCGCSESHMDERFASLRDVKV